FPGVHAFAQQMKEAVMSAHDLLLYHHTKQTRDENCHCIQSPFVAGNLVYISTKNISFPKGHACKLLPKYIGPYKIL
ncbi:hypothetical protein GYMLUDRAFT_103499, partial [Collybiopsis luxurians FD-317 M1]